MFETQEQMEKQDPMLPVARPASRQHRLMAAALVLLIVALGIVIYRGLSAGPDEEADYDEPTDTSAAATPVSATPKPVTSIPAAAKPHVTAKKNDPAPPATTAPVAAPPPVETQRTVLPPLEVEVVAGDTHRTVRPGSNSVRLDLQAGVPPKSTSEPTVAAPDSAASNTHAAAEKVEMSSGEQFVIHTVRPDYPLLARQAKVQGSVILQALIGRDGVIQNLRVVGGPPILASAAEDAVRQWRFKPHVIGLEAVETQAKITVNFTISTN